MSLNKILWIVFYVVIAYGSSTTPKNRNEIVQEQHANTATQVVEPAMNMKNILLLMDAATDVAAEGKAIDRDQNGFSILFEKMVMRECQKKGLEPKSQECRDYQRFIELMLPSSNEAYDSSYDNQQQQLNKLKEQQREQNDAWRAYITCKENEQDWYRTNRHNNARFPVICAP